MLKSSIKTERFHICISPRPFPPSPSFFMTCSFFLSITGRITVTDECVVSVWATERKSHPQANLLSNGKRCCLSPCVVASCFLPHSRGLVHLLFHPLCLFLTPFYLMVIMRSPQTALRWHYLLTQTSLRSIISTFMNEKKNKHKTCTGLFR